MQKGERGAGRVLNWAVVADAQTWLSATFLLTTSHFSNYERAMDTMAGRKIVDTSAWLRMFQGSTAGLLSRCMTLQ